MHTIYVPIEKRKSKHPRDEGRQNTDPECVRLDMNVTESKRGKEAVPAKSSLKSCLKNSSQSVYNVEKDVPPPYVIWVQFMGNRNQEPPDEPLDYDPYSRNSFVQKVFILVLIMLLICAGICVVINVMLEDLFYQFRLFLLIPAMGGLIAVNYAIMCSPCSRKAPCSYICLFIAAVCAGVLAACITMHTRTVLVYCALAATVIVVLVCFGLAFSSFDFTKHMLFIVMISVAISAILFIYIMCKMIFKIELKPLHIALLFGSVLIECIALAMELQMVLGGKTVELGVDEYAAGALMIFMSIFNIFMKLLQLANLFDD